MRHYFLQRGLTLIEVLIAVMIIAIGMLGIAGLQTRAVRYNHSAFLRSIAIVQANNMLDRMLANMAGVNSGAYSNIGSSPGQSPGCSTCTTGEIAARDQYEWNTNNTEMLPLGAGTVVQNGDLYTITIKWDGTRSGQQDTEFSFQVQL